MASHPSMTKYKILHVVDRNSHLTLSQTSPGFYVSAVQIV